MNSLVPILLGLSFLVLCSGECNPGWTEHDGKCYQVTMFHNADIRLARRYCMFYGGDLAYINNSNSLNFTRTLIADGSPTPEVVTPPTEAKPKIISGGGHLSGPELAAAMKNGTRVVRGVDWMWGDQDGPAPSEGTVIRELNSDGWIRVRWDHDHVNAYRMVEGHYELQLAPQELAQQDSPHNPGEDENEYNYYYWIREDSQIMEPSDVPVLPPPPNLCAYTSVERGIEYGDCDTKQRFICEMEKRSPNMFCLPSSYMYNQTCYYRPPMLGNYAMSAGYCSLLHSRLVILDDLVKEQHFGSIIIGQNKTFMVDATRINGTFKWFNGTFKWSNGKDFQPNCVDCVQHSNGDCLGYKSDPEHPLQFSWVYLNCSSPNIFYCETDAIALKPATTTTPTPTWFPGPWTTTTPTTTHRPTTTEASANVTEEAHNTHYFDLECPTGYNWKAHEESGFCYWETTYEADKLNWHQARAFCQAYGGDLASYQNEEEEKHGLGGAVGHTRGLWFGLERTQNDNFHWVDGSPLGYTNWDYAQPPEGSRSKFCGMHGPNEGKWQLDYCGVRRWFICKAPLVRNPPDPDLGNLFKKTHCNVSSSSVYRYQWYLYKDHCYLVNEEPSYSWGMARNFCNDNDAQLASIHSFAETDFILLLGSVSSISDYWIGLSSFGIGSSRTWSDETLVDFLYWKDGYQPNDQSGINSCVTFDKQRGFWQIEHCNRLLGVICKRRLNSSLELTTPQPTPLLPGNCEKGWYSFGNQCYKTFGERWSQRIKWSEAKDNCEGVGASLASIHNKEEQDFLQDLLLHLGCDAWIGLQCIHSNPFVAGSYYEWSDDTSFDYANWGVNERMTSLFGSDDYDDEPGYLGMSRKADSCIKLSLDAESIGKWKDVACSFKNAYICQKLKNVTITEPSEDLFVCSNITGWSRLGSSCYGFFEETVPWMDAQRKCRTYGADLVSFRNSALSIFLQKRFSRKYQFFWTGIRSITENEYVYLNGQRLKYSNWLPGQPQRVSNLMDNCAAMNLDAKWVLRSCKEKFPFVCEWNPDGDKTEGIIEKRHIYTCPNISEWEDIGTGTCYIFNLDHRATWNDAMSYCFRHGGHLASLHSSKEAELVRQHIVDNTAAAFVHIGLGKRKDGSYGWADFTPLNYVQWDEDEPAQDGYDCVELFIRNGKWRSVDCDRSLRGFICSSTRDSNAKASSTDSITEENIVGRKLAIGGFIGIAICVIVVFAIAAVTAYYVCPYTRMRVRLLDSP